ncbi:MAG TPA: protein O-GlcNAcase [Chloroflexota bacterium]
MLESSPFGVRGAIEGFYGAYYTFPERKDLIRFLGRHGFNFYLYGPKNDRQHRMRWWDPYPFDILEQFGETIHVAEQSGVTFCYAISFGVPMNYASPDDFAVITRKFRDFYDRGCRSFGVLMDDVTDGFVHDVNRLHFQSAGRAHADICNRLFEWARSLDDSCTFYMCPTEYSGAAPFTAYLHDLGAALHPDVNVFYTGREISSRTITVQDVNGFAEAIGRAPVIWDNYPVNDLLTRSEMHIGPLLGRDPGLSEVTRGIVSNVMTEEEASKIALHTIAEFERHPDRYDPERAWKRSLLRIAGHASYEPLARFAENSLRSCLQDEQAPEMTRLCARAISTLRRGESASQSEAVAALNRYLDVLDESCYHLKNRMQNLKLRDDLLPWIEALEAKFWAGRRAILTLKAIETGLDYTAWLRVLDELLIEIDRLPKSIGGNGVLELAAYARERVAQIAGSQVPPAETPLTIGGLDSGPRGLQLPAASSDQHEPGAAAAVAE